MSALVLKIIAMISMLIDHTGILLNQKHLLTPEVYMAIRAIGRLAFPLYGFLLVEGAKHTKNKLFYALRILLLFVLSEVPYDLLNGHTFIYFNMQNVYLTLLLGLLAIYYIQWAGGFVRTKLFFGFLGGIVIVALAVTAGKKLEVDYHGPGVLMLSIMGLYGAPLYNLRFRMMNQEPVLRLLFMGVAIGALAILLKSEIEFFALLALIPIYFYNGKKGYESKLLQYSFYLFYPAHLLILGLIATYL